jgi:hypothetical protein
MGGLAPLPDGGYIRGPASPGETLLRAGWQVQDPLEADLDNGNGPHCPGRRPRFLPSVLQIAH